MGNLDRITIFTGHFGSGKTELAINYAVKLAEDGLKTVIVDLDIVNPFFRSTEVKDILIETGVRVLSPIFAGTTVDVPSLPPDIYSVFQDKESRVIFDVGGDDVGAAALGRYYPYFVKEGYQMFYVINACRPLSSTKEDIVEMLRAVEGRSRLMVSDLINNTNLSYETRVCDIIDGHEVVKQVADELGIPIAFIAGVPEILEQLPKGLKEKTFPINIYMKPPWGK